MRSPATLLASFVGAASVSVASVLAACATTATPSPPLPSHVVPSPPHAPAAVQRPAPPPAYLAPDAAGGSPFCLDPASPTLRAALRRPAPTDADAFDAASLADDVRDLHAAMKKLYAGYPELLQNTTFDVDRFFIEWERDLRAAGPSISFAVGVVDRLVALRMHITDSHLSVYGGTSPGERPELSFAEYQAPGRVPGFDAARCAFTGATPVAGTARVVKLLTRAGTGEISTFSARSVAPFVDVRCGDQTVRFERRPRRDRARDAKAPVYDWRTVGDATVINVRSLSGSPSDVALLSHIAEDAGEHAKKKTIVFDFRGNGGGDDGYVFAWIAKLVRGSWPAAYAALHVTGAASACGDWNHLVANQVLYDRVDTKEGLAEREAFQREKPLGGRPGDPVQLLNREPDHGNAAHPYAGRVFALVDRASASSGESAPEALRLALHATLVGERTGGFAEYGNVRPYMMPRTGIFWLFASKRNYFDTPREGVGFPVDVVLDGDLLEAPVEELLPLLQALPPANRAVTPAPLPSP